MTQAGENVEGRITGAHATAASRHRIVVATAPLRIDKLATRLVDGFVAIPGWVQVAAAVLVSAFYVERIAIVYRDTGLFRRIGFDWGLFYSQAAALAAGDLTALYSVDRLTPYLQRLVPYTATPNVPLLQWPSPYPPVMAGVLAPLTVLPPPVAFGIWTVLSILAGCHLVWRMSQVLPTAGKTRLAVILFTALPTLQVLVLGQPMLLLASATAECFLALRSGRELRGGLWLGVLALKPQYGLLLGLYILWNRCWRAVLGALGIVGLIVVLSALLAGPDALWEYQRAVAAMGGIRDEFAKPAEMVNWRSLIVNLRPGIGNTSGLLLVLTLSVLTVGALVWALRTRNRPAIDIRLAAVLVATMLVSYHSHMHGLVLLAVPLAAVWRNARPSTRLAVLAFTFTPNVVFILVTGALRGFAIDYEQPLWVVWPVTTIACLVLMFAALLREARSTT